MAAILAVVLWLKDREPVYQGRTLSQWLIAYAENQLVPPIPRSQSTNAILVNEATNAVHHMGTNALPFLVKWMGCEVPKWRQKVPDIIVRAPVPFLGSYLANELDFPAVRAGRALSGFEILRGEAAPAVPAITQLLQGDCNSRAMSHEVALTALMCVGKEGLPPLVKVVTNKAAPTWFRASAACRLASPVMNLGTNACWAVPLLLPCLEESNMVRSVVSVLGEWKVDAKDAVPALTRCFRKPDVLVRADAAGALAAFGREASPAVPDLLAATSDKEQLIRVTATRALQRIAPEVLRENGHQASGN